MKRFFKYLGIVFLILVIILIGKTLLLTSKQPKVVAYPITVTDSNAIHRLQKAIQIATVSHDDPKLNDSNTFIELHKHLQLSFPTIYSRMSVKTLGNHALLFELKGSDPSLRPIILMAHQDVVPADSARWKHLPFSGESYKDSIWGRGTLDNKGSLMAIMEAMEFQLKNGYNPKRTILLAFGDDEETAGNGAKAIVHHLKIRGVKAEMVLDEGMAITQGMVPLVSKPVALVGTAEKGYATIKLEVIESGGHSSTPKSNTAISTLSKAITEIHEHPLGSRFSQPVDDFLTYLGPEIEWPAKAIFANRWIFNPVIKSIYKSSPAGNAIVTTTIVPTIIQAGSKENAIPSLATAYVNARILPGDSPESVLAYIKEIVNNKDINITLTAGRAPSPSSPVNVSAYERLSHSIARQYKDTYVMPTLMLAGSDSRYYSSISQNVYRFAPYKVTDTDLERIHGVNERIAINDYLQMIGFYQQVLIEFKK